jgi:hypothetical protein
MRSYLGAAHALQIAGTAKTTLARYKRCKVSRVGQRLRAALLSEHEQELQQRADVTQEILDASISLAASPATRQAVLIRSQRFFAQHPEFARDPNVRALHCAALNNHATLNNHYNHCLAPSSEDSRCISPG